MKNYILILSAIMLTGLSSCFKGDYEDPPLYSDANLIANQTLSDLKKWFAEDNVNSEPKIVTEDWIIEGIVTSSDQTGNIYKQIYLQDATGGICISIDMNNTYALYPAGRKVYVKLKGLHLGTYGGLVQIGYDVDEQYSPAGVFRLPISLAEEHIFYGDFVGMPEPIAISDMGQLTDSLQSMLIKLQDVEIPENELGATYADAITQQSKNRTLGNCNGQSLTLRNSGYASFAGVEMPKGKGAALGIFTVFNGTLQMLISDTSDLSGLSGIRCDGSDPNASYLLNEGFANLNDWVTVSVKGSQEWTTASYGVPAPCAKMSGYAGGNNENEDWLISKELDLSGLSTVTMSFLSASKYAGEPLRLYVSTDYTGSGLPSAANWVEIPANFDTAGDFSFNPSGPIDLSAYAGQKIRIGFKYLSTNSAATTWELDNIKVTGQ